MAPAKCNHTIFSKGNANRNSFGLTLFGELIPYEKNPVSLGIMFNESLSFVSQINRMKSNCIQRLNIIKILSHKSWKLDTNTLVSIYKSLVGSVLDYSSFLCPRLSDSLMKSVQAVQNRAMRSIFHRPRDETTARLCELSGLGLVRERMSHLNDKYFRKAIHSENVLITDLLWDFTEVYTVSQTAVKTLLCDHANLLELLKPADHPV